jgi:predicted kinase
MANKTLYILRGIPGSGKTTHAKRLAGTNGAVISADDYFMRDGEYCFDASKLGEAHAACFRRAVWTLLRTEIAHVTMSVREPSILEPVSSIVIDNTNILNIEVAPYVLLAQAYGWEHKIIAVHTEKSSVVAACAARNTHGVPVDVAVRMHELLIPQLAAAPPWWSTSILDPEQLS